MYVIQVLVATEPTLYFSMVKEINYPILRGKLFLNLNAVVNSILKSLKFKNIVLKIQVAATHC